MAKTLTLAELRAATRQRADMVNSQFVTDAELNSYINQSYFELYDLLVSKYGDNYYVAPAYTITTNGTDDQYALPTSPLLYKLLGVDLGLSNTSDSYVTIRPFEFIDRNRYAVPNFQSFYGLTNLRYRLNGDKIWFTPIPAANQRIRLWYIPRMTTLALDTDTVDGVSGWTEYIICDAAMKCMQKEESDVSVLMAEKQMLIRRIEAMAESRDVGSPAKVSDNLYSDFWFPTGSGSGTNWGTY
jgi:hypothetical protein